KPLFDLTKVISNSILESSSKLIILIDGTNWTNQENIVKDNVDGENQFLHALRGLIRNTYSSAIITIPAYLYEPINASFVRKIEHICDAVIEIESFDNYQNPVWFIQTSFNGLFHIHKLPTIKFSGSINHGAVYIIRFKLRRKRFSIEVFHLPPEGDIKETKPNNDNPAINEQKNFVVKVVLTSLLVPFITGKTFFVFPDNSGSY
ncbi:23215_t:CDS:2, partial [Entrophospora sp. SA101]